MDPELQTFQESHLIILINKTAYIYDGARLDVRAQFWWEIGTNVHCTDIFNLLGQASHLSLHFSASTAKKERRE